MKNYKDRIKHLINHLYEPGDVENFDAKLTTSQIYSDLCSIIPSNAIDKFDVVEALEEMNFQPFYEQKKQIVVNEKGEEKVKIYDDLTYFWYLKKKS